MGKDVGPHTRTKDNSPETSFPSPSSLAGTTWRSPSHSPHSPEARGLPTTYLPALLQKTPRSAERVMENELQRELRRPPLGPPQSLSQGRPPLRGNVLPQRGVGAPSSPPRGLRSHSLGRGTAECLASCLWESCLWRSQADCTPGNSWQCVLADPASSWVVPRAGSSCLHTFVDCCSFHLDAL